MLTKNYMPYDMSLTIRNEDNEEVVFNIFKHGTTYFSNIETSVGSFAIISVPLELFCELYERKLTSHKHYDSDLKEEFIVRKTDVFWELNFNIDCEENYVIKITHLDMHTLCKEVIKIVNIKHSKNNILNRVFSFPLSFVRNFTGQVGSKLWGDF